jgi:replicative DNA helicase
MFGSAINVVVRKSDLMMIIAPTGVGKSRILANLPFKYPGLNFAIFDLELSPYQLGLRAIAYHNNQSFDSVERRLRDGSELKMPVIENVFLPRVPALSVEKIKAEIDRLEDLQERRIDVVAVDYISKMNRAGGSITESIIANCIDLKRYLVEENRIGIITTQSRRINDKVMKYNMPRKEDSIYTSAIEQNCQQAMCFCFAKDDHNTMLCSCDKYSHGTEPSEWTELDVSNMRIEYKGEYNSEEGW